MRCDFCGSPRPRWRYRVKGDRAWDVCDRCREPIERDDRAGLLDRALLAPVPRTVPDRYAPRFRERARQLHEEFWVNREGNAERL